VANLPPVSTTPAAPVAKFAAVLIPVVHLDLQISLQSLKKILNDPNVIFMGLGEDVL
jgi:hypothetical protein